MAPWGKFASTNQKHYPYLSSDTSSVWNFCTRFQFAGKPVVASQHFQACVKHHATAVLSWFEFSMTLAQL